MCNPGLRHIAETIVYNLDNQSAGKCQLVSKSFRDIIEEKFQYIRQIQKIKSAKGRRSIEGETSIVEFTSIHHFQHQVALLDAIDLGKSFRDLKIVAKYITAYVAKQDFSTSPFYQACKEGHFDFIKLFINDPFMELSETDDQGYTIYCHVSASGFKDVFQLLIKRTAREMMKEGIIKSGLTFYDDMLAHSVQALPMAQTKEWHKQNLKLKRKHTIIHLIRSI